MKLRINSACDIIIQDLITLDQQMMVWKYYLLSPDTNPVNKNNSR